MARRKAADPASQTSVVAAYDDDPGFVPDEDTEILSLHWQQAEVIVDPARFKVLAAGRRWGKTTLMRSALLESASERPGNIPENWHAYIAPDLQQARRVMWRPLLDAVPRSWIEKEPNQTRMEIQLVTGQIIVCLGADNPDSLRGMGFRRVVLDEYADMPGAEIWEPILLPALLTANGDAIIGGTPKGFDHFYELYRRGQEQRANWAAWRYPTRDAPHITAEMYAELVAEYTDPRMMRQELEASFESSSGTVLGNLWKNTHVVQLADAALIKQGFAAGQVIPWHVLDAPDWLPPTGAKIYGSVDYGFGAPCAIYLHAQLAGGHSRTFWELYQRELHDHEQARRLREAIDTFEKQGVARPEWVVLEPVMYGSRREQGLAKSIAEVYSDALGSVTQLLPGAGGRSARLSRPQRWMAALGTAPDGLPWWSITTACPQAVRSIKAVRWDEDDPEVPDDNGDDHAFESCLVAGTLVETRAGPVAIEAVRAGDDVLTRDGYRAVTRAWLVDPAARLLNLTCSDGRTLTGTAEHRIWTEDRGFTRLDELADGDILTCVSDIKCRRKRQNVLLSFLPRFKSGAVSDSGGAEACTTGATASCSIGGFGSIFTAGFPALSTSIIGTRTGRTTIPTTFKRSPRASISRITASPKSHLASAPRVAAISRSLRRHGWPSQPPSRFDAHDVESRLPRRRGCLVGSPTAPNFAGVGQPNLAGRLATACRFTLSRAWDAPRRSRQSGRGSGSAATLSVITVRSSGLGPVYDLTVEGTPEFFANGILVHNCGRYFEARPHGARPIATDPFRHLDDDPISKAHAEAQARKYAPQKKAFDITGLVRPLGR